MSIKSWLFPNKKHSPSDPSVPAGASASRNGTPRKPAGSNAASAKRKAERAGRRELLYTVVRETMVRAGVLSASYKFKVLSLDADGRQFLIMIDLARGAGAEASRLAEIEALLAQSAKSRHELVVTAVYWRLTDLTAVGRPGGARQDTQSLHSGPMPLESQPVPLHSAPAPLGAGSRRGPAYEPIEADEVEAFRKALVAGSTGPVPLAVTPASPGVRGEAAIGRAGPRSYTLLTGYEDTELPEPDQKSPLLSGTQYGELR